MINACRGRVVILCALIALCSIKNSALSSEQTKSYYQMQATGQTTFSDSNAPAGYTIITTSEIESTSTKLADFVAHKQSLGFNVRVITEADFGWGIGNEAAENIRAWLQANYIAYNIEYVLLIGDPRTDIGEIPMKILWPTSYGSRKGGVPSINITCSQSTLVATDSDVACRDCYKNETILQAKITVPRTLE